MLSWIYSELADSRTFKIVFYLFLSIPMLSLIVYNNTIKKTSFFPFLAVIFIFLHSLFFSIDSNQSFNDSCLLLSAIIFSYLLVLSGFICKKNIKYLAIALSFFITITSYPQIILGAGFVDGNFTGVFFNSNYLGIIISVICLPVLFEFSDKESKLNIYSLNLILIFIVLLETRSRTSLVTAIAGCYLYLYLRTCRNVRISTILLNLFVIGIISYFSLQFIGNKYEGDDGVLSTRAPLLEQRIMAISEKPLIGWGFGSDTSSYFSSNVFDVFPAFEKGNFYLAVIEEFGVFLGGSILFFLISKVFNFFLSDTLDISMRIFFPLALVSSFGETWILNPYGWLGLYFWIMFIFSSVEVRNN